jgi:hypothetical protein
MAIDRVAMIVADARWKCARVLTNESGPIEREQ